MSKNFYIHTFGCTANKSDSEIMAGLLKREGYKLSNLKDAECVIVNTCGVKSVTEERVINFLKSLSKLNKKLIIAGCLPKINFQRIKKEILNFAAMLDPQSIDKIVEVIRKLENGCEKVIEFSDTPPIKPSLPKNLFNSVVGITQISEGCNLACSYCCTRFARGRLKCFPMKEVVECVKRFTNKGCKEIHITSQDNSSYNFNGTKLPQLLNEICKIEERFFIRVGMLNPLYTKDILDELIECYKNEKIFKFLHLPIQSFSPRILSLMKRGYQPNVALDIINKFYKAFPDLTLSTDIIVGFPTEDDSDFEETIKFVEQIKPDVINISRFRARPGTEAKKLKQHSPNIVNKRSKELFELTRRVSLEKNQRWLGWQGECLIDERGTKKDTWMGRNFTYKPVVVYSTRNLLGKFVNVEIIEARSNYLIGRLISESK
ncbi:MAG: tRNA (N(6)-L-threonylcarbamoyladenosine(37)-C(2))-methylthiotransferase [Candidatus Aenigmarchaeota archaeon]|nr:tRNA (N(6)-L-threonylcarbamoyladenosine(37)-C(2))-methylthiotransferase [Candidatus Aenigmarchaeota archaeon]